MYILTFGNGGMHMTLKELSIGSSAIVTAVGGEGALRQHFLDMGVIPGAQVTLVKFAPMGDPMELRIHGYELTLRLADAEKFKSVPSPRRKRQRLPRRIRQILPHIQVSARAANIT